MKVKDDDRLVIMGDWNAVVGGSRVYNCLGMFGLIVWTEKRNRLIGFYKSHTLVIANTCFEQLKKKNTLGQHKIMMTDTR